MTSGAFANLVREIAVSVDGDRVDVADLVLLGVLTGGWTAFEAQLAVGLALEVDRGEEVSDDEVRRAATAFRYSHGLISAADFIRWLDAREMTINDVSGVLRRRLLRERYGAASALPPPNGRIVEALPAEAFAEGTLWRLAELAIDRLVAGRLVPVVPAPVDADRPQRDAALANALALHAPGVAELGVAELGARLDRLLSLDHALEQLRRDVATPAAVARRIKDHALAWLEVDGDELAFDREGAAREARLLIAVDGEPPAQVAERAGVAVLDRRLLVDEAAETVGVSVAAAAVGEVVGPWEEDGRWRVLQVRDKVPASAENEALRERAIDELLRERLAQYAAGRVTRHVEL